MKERLTRVFLLGLAALVIIALASAVANWQTQQKVAGESTGLPQLPIKEKIENLGEEVLGRAIKALPGAPEITTEEEVVQETEPIEEPVKNVQEQTQTLIEAIKKLPEDQVEAIKKQLYKEFCEGILQE